MYLVRYMPLFNEAILFKHFFNLIFQVHLSSILFKCHSLIKSVNGFIEYDTIQDDEGQRSKNVNEFGLILFPQTHVGAL